MATEYPSFELFTQYAEPGVMVPLCREILADTETPVSALMKFAERPEVFLLESVEGGEKWGRYTFLGFDPRAVYLVRGDYVEIREGGVSRCHEHQGDPLRFLEACVGSYRPVLPHGIDLPRFFGGAVGYLGYDMVRFIENLPTDTCDDGDMAEACFLVTDGAIIFDNLRHTMKIVVCACVDPGDDLRVLYDRCVGRIDEMAAVIAGSLPCPAPPAPAAGGSVLEPDRASDEFAAMVRKAKQYISDGDVIQVVLSQRFRAKSDLDPIRLYRALRFINPSPYLFFLKLDGTVLIGSSPEVMVRLEEGIAELRPIAGTRRRSRSEQEDRQLADELLQDPKERAEHVMLVDLGRNDLGKVARPGGVQVTQLMAVERYSHVMHLVSTIRAQLDEEKTCFDLLKACFPAGTLTGAPKIRAMEIIEELETTRRGPYGGAVGYIAYTGAMDLCITIRTILVRDGVVHVQAGAGIVADSDPSAEYEETLNKAGAMKEALQLAASDFFQQGAEGERR